MQVAAISEHSNRGLPVTDKWRGAWHKRTIRCEGCAGKSVCREGPLEMLAGNARPVYRLQVNRSVQTCGIGRPAFWRKLTEDNQNCSAPGAVPPEGCNNARLFE